MAEHPALREEERRSMRTQFLRRAAATAVAILAASCDSTGPEEVPADQLNIVRIAAASPPLESTTLGFYAVRGQTREGSLYFQNESGGRGDEFLRLKFEDGSIVTDAGGLPVALGDSVLITVSVVDGSRILFDFQPSGIVFNPLEMPQLRIRYAEAEGDLDHDGDVDGEDGSIEDDLAIWRQETLADPFVRLGSFLFKDVDEIEADLPGFTRYAIAY